MRLYDVTWFRDVEGERDHVLKCHNLDARTAWARLYKASKNDAIVILKIETVKGDYAESVV